MTVFSDVAETPIFSTCACNGRDRMALPAQMKNEALLDLLSSRERVWRCPLVTP